MVIGLDEFSFIVPGISLKILSTLDIINENINKEASKITQWISDKFFR